MIWEEILERAKIMVVDDDYSNVRLLERMLKRVGYQHIGSTTESTEAVDLYQKFQPDLILLDLGMPGLDGFEVMEQLREYIPESTYVPILVLTGDLANEKRLRALLLGAKDFLTKPVETVEALLRIRILLETRFLFRRLEDQVRDGGDR